MKATADIESPADIKLFVNQFYLKVRNDELLAPVFNKVIREDQWEQHLEKMYAFWETILLHNRKYSGDPLVKHLPLNVQENHFARWLSLFEETVNNLFYGSNASEALKRAKIISKLIMHEKKIPIT